MDLSLGAAKRIASRKRLIASLFLAYKALAPIATSEGVLGWASAVESQFAPGFVYFIQTTDGACLGLDGFGPCDEEDLWAMQAAPPRRRWQKKREGHALVSVELSDAEGWHARGGDKHDDCLQRRRRSDVAVGRCGHGGAADWALDAQGRLSQDAKRHCMVRTGDHKARMQDCREGWTPLVLRRAEFARPDGAAASAATAGASSSVAPDLATPAVPDGPTWAEPESGQVFRRTLDGVGTSFPPQTLVAGGAYVKAMVFTVYAIGFYFDVPAAMSAPEFSSFRGDSGDGSRQKELLAALARSSSIDKSVVLRLAMPVGRDAAIRAMNSDFDLDELQKRLLVDTALRSGDGSCCGTGTELRFTSRRNGNLEVYLDGRQVDVLSSAGLSEGLWRQYVGDSPVSVATRDKLATALAGLLGGGHPAAGPAHTHIGSGSAAAARRRRRRRRQAAAAAAAAAGSGALDGALESGVTASGRRLKLVWRDGLGRGGNARNGGSYDESAGTGSLIVLAVAALVAFLPNAARGELPLPRNAGVARRLTYALGL